MKFMLLQNYGGVDPSVPPMSEWTPEEAEAHIAYQRDLRSFRLEAARPGISTIGRYGAGTWAAIWA